MKTVLDLFTKLQRFEGRFAYASWVDVEIGYFYVETPKVACSKIKSVLQSLSGFPIPSEVMSIHYRKPPSEFVSDIFSLDDQSYKRSLDDLFKFCFVRDPFERLYSAYKDKVINSKGDFWDNYRKQIRSINKLTDSCDITFESFVNYVEITPDHERDIHWRSQSRLLKPSLIPYDFIGNQETFDRDFSHVLSVLGCENTEQFIGGKVNATNNYLEIPEKQKLKDRVMKIYKEDYEAFQSALS